MVGLLDDGDRVGVTVVVALGVTALDGEIVGHLVLDR